MSRSKTEEDRAFYEPTRRRREILAFLFLTVVLWPAIAVGLVGSWGLVVWLYQATAGHPSP